MITEDIIKEVYEEVKRRCYLPSNIHGIGAWHHHIELVYKLAISNYKDYNANYEIVALSSLLHDIASITNKDFVEEHHIIGAKMAADILNKYNIDTKTIELIKKCILNHRGSRLVEKTTPEEICIADCDAMAHFYSIPSLFSMVYKEKNMEIDKGSKFILEKLERSYNKLSEKGKEIIKQQYEATKVLLNKR